MSADPIFDPLSDLYLAQLHRPANLSAVNLRTLSAFHRALLAIDGTVTKFIEAYTLEPVQIVPIAQVRQELSTRHRWLEADPGTPVAVRHVLLRGAYSRETYAYAVSFVVLDRLPQRIRERVGAENEGLGNILADSQLEVRREVLWYGRERSAELPPEVGPLLSGDFISRTYRIILAGLPIMMINEKFPRTLETLPVHE